MKIKLIFVSAIILSSFVVASALPAYADILIGTISVRSDPAGVAVNPNTNTIYVISNSDNTVSAIDGNTDTVISTESVGSRPVGVAVNPTTDKIYVTNNRDDTVSAIYGTTDTVISVGSSPFGIAVNPTTNKIYVTNNRDNSVSVIDGNTDTVISTESVGSRPFGVAVNPTTDKIYVTSNFDSTISVIDGTTDTVISTESVGSSPFGVAVNPTTDKIYVTNNFDNTISVVDGTTDTVISTESVGSRPFGVAVNPTTNKIYVTNNFDNTISVIDGTTDTVIETITVGLSPRDIAVNPTTAKIYVTNNRDDTVSVLGSPSSQGGGGSDNKHLQRPTFGLSHHTYQQLVQDGFTVNNISYTITDNWHTDFEKQIITTGEENIFSAKLYAPYELQSLEFMFGIPEVGYAHKAEAAVEVWLNRVLEVEEIKVVQKDNLINEETVTASAETVPCTDSDTVNYCYAVKISASFNEAPINEVFALKAMDFTRRVHTTHFNDGFAVVGESLNPPKTALVTSEQKGMGLIQLIQVDKKNDLWVDENGYQWTKNKFDTWSQITKPEFQRHQDEISTVMTTHNSNFAVLFEHEKEKAKAIFDSALLQKELPDYFAYTSADTIENKLGDPEIQNRILEEIKAKAIFDSTLLQKELPDYFAYTFPDTIENKLGDPKIQNRMMIEEIKAKEILKEMLLDTLAKETLKEMIAN